MLDTIRSFAHDRLTAADEDNAATERFLHWAVHLATWFEQTIDTDDEPLADRVLRREIVNLRSAWRLVRSHQRLDDAVRMAVAFGDASTWATSPMWDWALDLVDDPKPTPIPKAHPCSPSPPPVPGRGDLATAERLARRGLERRPVAHGVATPRSRSSPSATPTSEQQQPTQPKSRPQRRPARPEPRDRCARPRLRRKPVRRPVSTTGSPPSPSPRR